MEIDVVIKEVVDTKQGVNETTGNEWKFVTYRGESDDRTQQSLIFEVWDGRDGRISRLNLEVGKKYRVFLDIEARKTKEGRWFNKLSAWNARLITE